MGRSLQQPPRAGRGSQGGGGVEREPLSQPGKEERDENSDSSSSKVRLASNKTSYAQALKTSLAEPGWSTSRSHTPSETSLVVGTRTPTPVSAQVPAAPPSPSPSPAAEIITAVSSPSSHSGRSSSQLSTVAPSDPLQEEEGDKEGGEMVSESVAGATDLVSLESESQSEQEREDGEEGEDGEMVTRGDNELPSTSLETESVGGCGLPQAPPPSMSQVQQSMAELVPKPLLEAAHLPPDPPLPPDPGPVRSLPFQPPLERTLLPQQQLWPRPLSAHLPEHLRVLRQEQGRMPHLPVQLTQQQLLLLQHHKLLQQQSQKLHPHQRQAFPDSVSMVTMARLPAPRQQFHLVNPRPLMTTPTPGGSAHQLPHPQGVVMVSTPLQQQFHQTLLPQQKPLFSLPPHSRQELGRAPTISPPCLQATVSRHSMQPFHGGFRGNQQPEMGERDGKVGLSVTASPFVPGGKSEQGAKKRSPPVGDLPAPPHPHRPPGFDQPSLATRPLLLQPTLLPAQPLPRPITTHPTPPLVTHPPLPLSLPPSSQLAALQRLHQPVAKPGVHHLHTTRPATRPLSFFQYHHPHTRGDALLLHDPAHHQKATPTLSDSAHQSHSLLEQAKLLQVSSVFPPGSAGLIPNPYTTGGVAFMPPIAIPTVSLTTPTLTPPQTLPLLKGGVGIAQKKPLLPTPTAPQAVITGVAPSGTRLPLTHLSQQVQQHHGYH